MSIEEINIQIRNNDPAFPVFISDGYEGICLTWQEWDYVKDTVESQRRKEPSDADKVSSM